LFVAIVAAAFWFVPNRDARPPEMRLAVLTPAGSDPVSLAVSPDGRTVAFVADEGGRPHLWLRRLSAITSQPVPGSAGASLPFWSPDSRHLGFFADGMLRRISIDGGSAQTVAAAPDACGGAWTTDSAILFVPDCDGPIFRVHAAGGELQQVTQLVRDREAGHRFPQILPDSHHVLFFADGSPDARGEHVIDARSGERRRLVATDSAAVYAIPGYLLFVRQGVLLAQQLDPRSLAVGDATSLSEEVAFDPVRRVAAIAASPAGPIVYRTGSATDRRQLVLFDREGRATPATELDIIGPPSASRDGRRVAFSRAVNGNADIWILDIPRQLTSRFTFDATSDSRPVWSPDGEALVFHSAREGQGVYRKSADGSGVETLLFRRGHQETVTDWSADGRFLLYHHRGRGANWDVSAMPVDGGSQPIPLLQSEFDEAGARFSPDVRWIAYHTNESGRSEIFVRSFPDGDTRAQVTSEGGSNPRWSLDGRTLFYVAPDGLLTRVNLAFRGSSIEVDRPLAAGVRLDRLPGGASPYDVVPYGFVATVAGGDADRPLTVLLNWNPRP
jgi:Tol biopolymer transport system component